jgi:hypothetical protein
MKLLTKNISKKDNKLFKNKNFINNQNYILGYSKKRYVLFVENQTFDTFERNYIDKM